MLKVSTFPSVNFPAAGMRVNSDTTYDLHCTSCGTAVHVDFGWIVRGERYHQTGVDTDLMEAARQHFQTGPFSHVELTTCPSCRAAFLIHAQIEETSNNAYRVVILGAAEMA